MGRGVSVRIMVKSMTILSLFALFTTLLISFMNGVCRQMSIGLLGKYDTFTSKEKTFQLLDEKTPVFMSCSPFTPYDYVDKASTYI